MEEISLWGMFCCMESHLKKDKCEDFYRGGVGRGKLISILQHMVVDVHGNSRVCYQE